MSWGAPPAGQNPYYGQQGGYGQQPAYRPPPASAPPPGQYGAPPNPAGGYGAPPPQQPGYGSAPPPAAGGYGAPPPQQGGYGRAPPPNMGYGGAPPPAQAGYGAGAPPPSGYPGAPPPATGHYGAPPPQGGYGAPPPHAGGYGQPPPPPGVSPDLWQWFQTVDQDRSGKITSTELQQALLNGNWSHFNPETCRLMIGMFDRDRNGTIDVHEFAALWKYIQDWKSCFDRFDTDRSGNINASELNNAFRTFGYNLSPNFCNLVVRVFDRQRSNTINFDDFIQCCVMLKSLTDKFREKDVQRQGVINIQYEEFLRMVLDNTVIR